MNADIRVFLSIILFFVFTFSECYRDDVNQEKIEAAKKYLASLDNHDKKVFIDPNDMFLDWNDKIVSDPLDLSETPEDTDVSNEFQNSQDLLSNGDMLNEKREEQADNQEMDDSANFFSGSSITKDSIYLKRWLKMFLSEVNIHGEGKKLVSIALNDREVARIQNTLDSEKPNFNDIEKVLSDVLSHVSVSNEENWFSRNMRFLNEKKALIAVTVLFVLVLVFLRNIFQQHPKASSFIVVALVSVVWEWFRLYQEAIAKKHAALEEINFPASCRIQDMGFWSTVQVWMKSNFVSQGSCKDYYKALMVSPISEVTPLMAVSATLSRFVFYPLVIFAETFNTFIIKLFKNLTFLGTVGVILFLFLILMMIFRYRIRLPFFLSFEPGSPFSVSYQNPNTNGSIPISQSPNFDSNIPIAQTSNANSNVPQTQNVNPNVTVPSVHLIVNTNYAPVPLVSGHSVTYPTVSSSERKCEKMLNIKKMQGSIVKTCTSTVTVCEPTCPPLALSDVDSQKILSTEENNIKSRLCNDSREAYKITSPSVLSVPATQSPVSHENVELINVESITDETKSDDTNLGELKNFNCNSVDENNLDSCNESIETRLKLLSLEKDASTNSKSVTSSLAGTCICDNQELVNWGCLCH